MKPQVKTKDFKTIMECITSDQVPPNTIALYFEDKKFYQYYKKGLDNGNI